MKRFRGGGVLPTICGVPQGSLLGSPTYKADFLITMPNDWSNILMLITCSSSENSDEIFCNRKNFELVQ